MPEKSAIKPSYKAIREYRETLDNYGVQGISHESALRSAFQNLLAVVDQYQVSEDQASGQKSDPNRPDDPEYIVRLVGQVVRVSVETVKIIKALPAIG